MILMQMKIDWEFIEAKYLLSSQIVITVKL